MLQRLPQACFQALCQGVTHHLARAGRPVLLYEALKSSAGCSIVLQQVPEDSRSSTPSWDTDQALSGTNPFLPRCLASLPQAHGSCQRQAALRPGR